MNTPDKLRAECVDYVLKQGELDMRGVYNGETPGGLVIELGAGWMTVMGTMIDFGTNRQTGSFADYSCSWAYEADKNGFGTSRLDVVSTDWSDVDPHNVTTIPRRNHHKVATGLMQLIAAPESFVEVIR